MLTAAGIEDELRKRLWAEAGNTAIHLANIQVVNENQKSPYELFTKKEALPKYTNNLKRFGEIGIILRPKKIQSKIFNKGQKAMMVGYGTQHAEGVYQIYKFDTKKITQTRDVRWLHKTYRESQLESNDSASDYYDSESENIEDTDDYVKRKEEEEEPEKKPSTRLEGELKRLHTSYNPTLSGLVFKDDLALVGGTDDLHKNPTSFQEA